MVIDKLDFLIFYLIVFITLKLIVFLKKPNFYFCCFFAHFCLIVTEPYYGVVAYLFY